MLEISEFRCKSVKELGSSKPACSPLQPFQLCCILCHSLKPSLPFRWLLTSMLLQPESSLNVTSRLWLRAVLFIAGQLKCEGSQWQDKYKGQRSGEVSQTKAGSSAYHSSLSSPPKLKGKIKKSIESKICSFYLIFLIIRDKTEMIVTFCKCELTAKRYVCCMQPTGSPLQMTCFVQVFFLFITRTFSMW